MISAIMLSYRRHRTLKKIIDRLLETGLVSDIILWNNDPGATLAGGGSVRTINSTHNYSTDGRYAAALLAREQTILFHDDDLLYPAGEIAALHREYLADPSRIYGFAGRNIVNGRYSPKLAFGEVDIVLGQFMLFSKELMARVYGDLLRLAPIDRGDDIAFSLLAGGKHICRRASQREDWGRDDPHGLWKQPDHLEKRQAMVDRVLAMRAN
jgi:hypothetical protein